MEPDEAAALFARSDTLGFGLGPANPDALLQAMSRRDDWEDLTLGGALLLGLYDVLAHPGVHYRCGFYGPVERLYKDKGADVQLVPAGFRQFAGVLARFAPRVMAVQAAPVDGGFNLSLHYGATRDELVAAGSDPDRVLIVEANERLPVTRALRGHDNTIPEALVDVVVRADGAPFVVPPPPRHDADEAIARIAADLVPDRATLQTGIGAVPSLVAERLAQRTSGGFGVHSEMLSDGLMALHVAGLVTNEHKGQFDGVSVTTFALGSSALYGWLDRNDAVGFAPVSLVNSPGVIRRNERFVSLNGALQVDLYGQVVADALDGRQVSGVGGHEDFVAGAELDATDRSIVCLRSTTEVAGELRSRIVPVLPEGAVVSTPRHHAGTIVTEFGAAELAGRTVRERARALCAIAHPQFRDRLAAVAATLDP